MSLTDDVWAELRIVVPPAAVEAINDVLFAHGCLGTSEEAASDPAHGPLVLIRAYFERSQGPPAAEALRAAWPAWAEQIRGLGRPRIQVDELPYGNWADAWKAHFRPVRIGQHIIVAPTWEPVETADDDVIVRVDPGMAFGTGAHETTRLCLAALESRLAARPGARVLDVGTGSGILALAAAHLGAGTVLGIDVDADAIASARENRAANDLTQAVTLSTTPLADVTGAWDVVVANILPHVLTELAPALTRRVAADGTLLLSGLLRAQRDEVWAAYTPLGWSLETEETLASSSSEDDEPWMLLVLRRSSRI